MSTNVGDELKAADLINWYTILNDTINIGGNQGSWKTSGGTVISSITVPSSASLQGTEVYASQIYAITDKINQLITDEYIKTQSGLYSSYNSALYSTTATVTYAVRAGCIIYSNALTPFLTTINNWKTSVKCRNLATFSYGSYQCGSYYSTTRYYNACTQGTNNCGSLGHTQYYSGTRTNGTYQCGKWSCGANTYTNMSSTAQKHGCYFNGTKTCSSYSSACNSGSHQHKKYYKGDYSSTTCTSGSKKDILCNCTNYKHG